MWRSVLLGVILAGVPPAVGPRYSCGMSQSASQASAFYAQVAKERTVWTLKDEGGYPAPKRRDGSRAMPFWSSRSRVERVIKNASAYAGFEPVSVSWDDFCAKWVPLLERDGTFVGVNWSGARATGYDLKPRQLVEIIDKVSLHLAATD
jgi:hypothetical protein